MNVVAEMLLNEPAPAVIWAMLTLLTFPALLLLGSPAGVHNPGQAVRDMVAVFREHGEQRRRQAEEAARATRYAEEVRVAADRAATSSERWQGRWQQASDDLDTAWRTWLDADARLRAGVAAAAWGAPWSVRTCQEYAAREQFLHRAVTAAAARGDLPADAVADALAGRNGWDARLHPVEQELVIDRAAAVWLRQRYERAAVAERAAWHDAELARRSSDSLRHEVRVTAAARRRTGATAGARRAVTAAF
jgi:hypothetical protein